MRIIDAVVAQDAEGARGAMAVHLERVRKVLLEGAEGERQGEV
jgi:DNA-binding GntR family transcriptional regulator